MTDPIKIPPRQNAVDLLGFTLLIMVPFWLYLGILHNIQSERTAAECPPPVAVIAGAQAPAQYPAKPPLFPAVRVPFLHESRPGHSQDARLEARSRARPSNHQKTLFCAAMPKRPNEIHAVAGQYQRRSAAGSAREASQENPLFLSLFCLSGFGSTDYKL